jgi:TonB family protein
MRWFRLFVPVVTIGFLLLQNAAGQAAAPSNAVQAGVVLSKLSQPIYPQMARVAAIQGDVEVKLGIRRDGSIESVAAVSGHPILKQAALDSAQQSQFECRACVDEVTSYFLTYSFQLATGTYAPPKPNESGGVNVVQSENHVTIFAEAVRIVIDNFAYLRVRSVKCLYLWSCGSRWGGEDYYYYRIRSAKCLYLWQCSLHRRDAISSRG